MEKKLTIKKDKNLSEICEIVNRQPEELVGVLIHMAKKAGVWVDGCEFAGDSLFSFFEDENFSLPAATLYCLGQSDPNLERLFSELKLWGAKDECPQCGCEVYISGDSEYRTNWSDGSTEIIYEKRYCSNPNCDYEEIEEDYPDPDLYADDIIY